MQEKQIHSEQVNEIAKALNKFQSMLQSAPKNSENPYFKSRYADLSTIWSRIQEPLSETDLSVTQIHDVIDGKNILVTILMHESGQWIKSYTPLMIEKSNAQSFGSASTYARRYGLAAVLGVTQEDDDGNAATFISKQQVTDLVKLLHGHPDILKQIQDGLKKRDIYSLERITHEMYGNIVQFVNDEIAKKSEAQNADRI